MSTAPIVLFVYNRPWHTQQTIEALQKNELAQDSELFIYSDASKNDDGKKSVNEVREYIKTVGGFKKVTIVERKENWGLANSIIDGVSKIVDEYGKIIVLEDDLLTSPYFLKFMNESLDFYQDHKQILSISGFSFSSEFMQFPDDFNDDVFLHIRPMSWGWATWKDKWENIDWEMSDFDKFIVNSKEVRKFNQGGNDLTNMLLNQRAGIIDSWWIRWTFHAYKYRLFTIIPTMSLVNSIGHDNSGTHCRASERQHIPAHKELSKQSSFVFLSDPKVNPKISKIFNKAFAMRLRGVLFLKFKLFLKVDKRMKENNEIGIK